MNDIIITLRALRNLMAYSITLKNNVSTKFDGCFQP